MTQKNFVKEINISLLGQPKIILDNMEGKFPYRKAKALFYYLSLKGRMYKDIYRERGLHPKNLSRSLEDTGTLCAPLVPWSTDRAFILGALGVSP